MKKKLLSIFLTVAMIATMLSALDITVYAAGKTVTLDYNGGNINGDQQGSVVFSEIMNPVAGHRDYYYSKSVSPPTRTGYTFKGFYTSTSGGTQFFTSTGASVYYSESYVKDIHSKSCTRKLLENDTLYAQWTANTYTIAYNTNGGAGSYNNISATYGVSYTLSSTKPTKTGYTFAGWNTAQNGTGTTYASGATVSNLTSTNSATVTLYAQWTANNYTVTLNTNGGTCDELTSYTYGTGATLPIPTKAGYNFAGWYENESFNGNPVTVITTTDTGNKEYFAKWEIDAIIEESENTAEFPSVQSKIIGNTATMRFMWQLNFADGAKIDNIGAYIIPWGLFDGTLTGSGSIVQYDDPEIQSGDTFSADLTDIPRTSGVHNIFEEMEISAYPFINGKLLGNYITSTVDASNID